MWIWYSICEWQWQQTCNSIRNVQRRQHPCRFTISLSLSLSACLPVRPLSSACPVMQFSCLVLLPVHTQFVPPLPPPPRSLLGLAVALNALSLLFVFNKFCVLSCLVYAACCLCVRVRVSVCSNICSLSGTGHCHAHCPFHAT